MKTCITHSQGQRTNYFFSYYSGGRRDIKKRENKRVSGLAVIGFENHSKSTTQYDSNELL